MQLKKEELYYSYKMSEIKHVLDARGLVCPYPSFLTMRKMKEIKEGILEVYFDKSDTTLKSMITTVKNAGYEYILEDNGNYYKIKIKIK